MFSFHQANRRSAAEYHRRLMTSIQAEARPEDFIGGAGPQKFYLEFKNRMVQLVNRKTHELKEELRRSDNCHLLLLQHSALADAVVQTAFAAAVWFYNRINGKNLEPAEVPIAIAARGGYGREELYFRSNVDLQIVYKLQPESTAAADILEYFAYLFIHQEIFPAVTSSRCELTDATAQELAAQKPPALLSTFEGRRVAGCVAVYDEFAALTQRVFERKHNELMDYCKSYIDCYSLENTVFQQEPNVKEEMRRLYWALLLSRLRHGLRASNQFEQLGELLAAAKLSESTFKKMQEALNFLAKTRLFLHCCQRGGQRDTMSYEVREQIAQGMNYELNAFYREYFYNAAYPLKRHSRNLFLEAMGFDARQEKKLSPHFALNPEKQIIFLPGGEAALETKPELIFQMLVWVAKENYALSYPVIRCIENNVDHVLPLFLDPDRRKQAVRRFREIVNGRHFAPAVRLLHEFGLLQDCFIPEFKKVCGLLQDIYVHKYPTDIHVLAALEKLNGLELGTGADPFLADLYNSLRDKTALKLAVLLHDIGKGVRKPGQNEEVVGAKLAPQILQKLDFDPKGKRVQDVAFLVEKHLLMRDLLLLDPEEDETYELIWDLVDQDKERLKMLILLTYADRGGTKMKMSASQIEQIRNFYQYTMNRKQRRAVANAVKFEFLKMIRLPRDLQEQLEIYNEFAHARDGFAAEMFYRPGQDTDLIVCTRSGERFLFHIATVLFHNRVNIVEANIYRIEANAFIHFRVCGSSGAPIEFSNYFFLQRQIKEELRRIFVGREPAAAVYKGKNWAPQAAVTKHKDGKPKIKVIGRSVFVESPDILGTFMMETKVFSDLDMEIQRAVLHTQHGIASNIFYLRPEDVGRIMQNEEQFKAAFGEALAMLQDPRVVLFGAAG